MTRPFLVERMTNAPGTCMLCGRGNTPDGDTGEIGPFIDLGLDYNWGDSGYLCLDCAGHVAVVAGWISPDTAKGLNRQVKKLEGEIHDLGAEMDMRRKRERQALRQARATA